MRNEFVSNLIKSYLTKFPKLPSLTLAKKIYAENNKTFKDVDAVRSCLRYYRGKKGEKQKSQLGTKDFLDQNIEFVMPESYAETFEPYEITQSRTLIISDLHIPYQDNDSIQKAINYGKEKKVNCILINGDVLDFAGISRHEKDWRQRSVHEEFEATRIFLNSLREHFPKAKIVFKYGNHDERFEKYLFLKAPEIFDCTDFQLEVLLKLGELKIEVVKDKLPIKIGKLTVLHGHELFGGSGGVNPARGTFLKTLENVVVGHYHKTSSNTEASMYGNVFSVHSIGCLCGKNPYFMPINKWNTGFAYCELEIKTGNYTFYNLKIINGKIY
jgi:predicted phosphodiesterase